MPRVQREANVTWEGNVARGSGSITAATGAFTTLPYSLATRVEKPDGKTSPEELLAAASLAGELSREGSPPDHLDVHATVTLDQVEDGSHQIVASEVLARARVTGIDQETLDRVAQSASAGCTFSKLIAASGSVTVNATLEGDANGD